MTQYDTALEYIAGLKFFEMEVVAKAVGHIWGKTADEVKLDVMAARPKRAPEEVANAMRDMAKRARETTKWRGVGSLVDSPTPTGNIAAYFAEHEAFERGQDDYGEPDGNGNG